MDEHSDETYACSSQACDPEKQCVMAIKGEWWTQTAEDSAFTFMTLQLSLTLLCSQLFCFINVCNSRLLHDPLKSKETMSLKGPTFPWMHCPTWLSLGPLSNKDLKVLVTFLFVLVFWMMKIKFFPQVNVVPTFLTEIFIGKRESSIGTAS